MNVSFIVLASGMSKRMKTNKLLLKLKNKMVFEYVLDTIKNCDFDEVIVVTRFKEIINYSKNLGYKVVENLEYEKGQSSSIKLGVENANKNNGYMFFVADQPDISKNTIYTLLEDFKKDNEKIVIPYYNGKKGNPVIFPNNLRKELLNLTGDKGGSEVIFKNKKPINKIEFNYNENLDIDTMKDYEEIRRQYER